MTSRKTAPRHSSRSRHKTSDKTSDTSTRGRPKTSSPKASLDPFLTLEPATGTEAERGSSVSVDPPFGDLSAPASDSGALRLYLAPRGPNSLFAYWNWADELLAQAARAADDGCVLLRLRRSDGSVREEHALPPGCRNWYFSLPEDGQTFSVDLGTYQTQGTQRIFLSLGSSQAVALPRFTPSDCADRTLVTLPPEVPFRELAREFRPVAYPGEQLLETMARVQRGGQESLRSLSPDLLSRWTSSWNTGQAAGSLGSSPSSFSLFSRPGSFPWPGSVTAWPGSVTAWPGSVTAWPGSVTAWPSSWMSQAGSFAWPASWTFSPLGASWAIPPEVGRERGFFLHVNAELILYGGTDPQAQVNVLGRPIRLQPDGTFRYHFLLPDGNYRIPIEAVSPDKVETRGATLSFLRQSRYQGKVDSTAQPPLPPEPLGRIPG